jgi:hypothetical protein
MADFPHKDYASGYKNLAGIMRGDAVQQRAGNKFYVKKAQMDQAEEISDAVPRGPFTIDPVRSYSGEDPEEAVKTTYRRD